MCNMALGTGFRRATPGGEQKPSMARPATIRYQPNGAKVWRPRKAMNARTTRIAVAKAASDATAISRPSEPSIRSWAL